MHGSSYSESFSKINISKIFSFYSTSAYSSLICKQFGPSTVVLLNMSLNVAKLSKTAEVAKLKIVNSFNVLNTDEPFENSKHSLKAYIRVIDEKYAINSSPQ